MAEQRSIPGVVPENIAGVERCLESWLTTRDEKKAATEAELEARETLINLMKESGLEFYRRGRIYVILEEKDKLTIKDVGSAA